MPNDSTPVWFIADASAGLAAALAEAVLDAGQRAVLAARDPECLRALAERHPGRAEAVALDVTDGAAVDAALRAAEARFGRIDVLAASALQRYFGAIEESDEAALRAVFEENVFAPVNLARRVLPGMRARRAGHVVLLARGAAHLPAGEGFCQAARSALEALAEALFHEVERFGIGVTLVDPGAGDDGRPAPARADAGAAIADYADLAGRQSGQRHAGRCGARGAGDPARRGGRPRPPAPGAGPRGAATRLRPPAHFEGGVRCLGRPGRVGGSGPARGRPSARTAGRTRTFAQRRAGLGRVSPCVRSRPHSSSNAIPSFPALPETTPPRFASVAARRTWAPAFAGATVSLSAEDRRQIGPSAWSGAPAPRRPPRAPPAPAPANPVPALARRSRN